jgi:hypothetical protein
MPNDPDVEDTSRALLELIKRKSLENARGPVSDPMLPPRPMMSGAERKMLRTPADAASRLAGQVLGSMSPFNTQPRTPAQMATDIGGAAASPLTGPLQGILKQLGPKIMKAVAEHPQEVKTLLTSAGLFGGATSASQGETGPRVAEEVNIDASPDEDPQEVIERALRSRLKKINQELEASKQQPKTVTTRRGTQITTGGTNPQYIQSLTEEKSNINTQLENLRERERPFLEKNAWWWLPGSLLGSGMLGRKLSSLETEQMLKQTGKIPTTGQQWKQALNYGALGSLEAPLTFLPPEMIDYYGSGRARKEARDPGAAAGKFGLEALGDIGASVVGAKTGIVKGAKNFSKMSPAGLPSRESVMLPPGGAADFQELIDRFAALDKGGTESPATNVVKQIGDPLAGMKSIPPAPKENPDEILFRVPGGHASRRGGEWLPDGGVKRSELDKYLAANPRDESKPRKPRVGKVVPGETEPAPEQTSPTTLDINELIGGLRKPYK